MSPHPSAALAGGTSPPSSATLCSCRPHSIAAGPEPSRTVAEMDDSDLCPSGGQHSSLADSRPVSVADTHATSARTVRAALRRASPFVSAAAVSCEHVCWTGGSERLLSRPARRTEKRLTKERVSRVIGLIGKKADIIVEHEDERTGRPTKYASAHDLRRSCGERLRNAGVPPLVICRVMRHSSWETTRKHYAPGDIQQDAEVLRSMLRPAETDPGNEATP